MGKSLLFSKQTLSSYLVSPTYFIWLSAICTTVANIFGQFPHTYMIFISFCYARKCNGMIYFRPVLHLDCILFLFLGSLKCIYGLYHMLNLIFSVLTSLTMKFFWCRPLLLSTLPLFMFNEKWKKSGALQLAHSCWRL